MNNKLHFLTFANTDFMNTDRIINQAKSFDMFDKIISLTEHDIPEYIEKHKQFINDNKYGYGLWIWKPKIILDTLNTLSENDIMLYCDAGLYLNNNGTERFKYYLDKLNDDNINIITFSTNDNYKSKYYVKNDAIMHYYPEFNSELNNDNACYAGIMIIKKNEQTLKLIEDWLILCENYHFLDRSNSYIYTDFPYYAGNDCDNGLFNLCLSKYKKIVFFIYPDEVNLYSSNGNQLAHTDIDYNTWDWNILDKSPFQCRRITPKLHNYNSLL